MDLPDHIITQATAGDELALRSIVDTYSDYIFTLVLRIVPIREEAEEVAQDVFLRAFRYLKQFKGECKFSTWLYKIAYTTALNHIRGQKTYTAELKEHHHQMGETTEAPSERWQQIEQAMKCLTEEERMLIQCHYIQEMSLAEISDVLSLTLSNTKVKLHRARLKMKNALSLPLTAQSHYAL
ncbi:MAG: RNA polymerase sigma factor [Chitinophagaceae bacterium]|nr:RNA polymerase sigma factor [Chitinophagaceae bacterium]